MNTRLTPDKIRPILKAAAAAGAGDCYTKCIFRYAFALLDFWREALDYPQLTEEDRDKLTPSNPHKVQNILLNGAKNWLEYSWGASHAASACSYDIICNLYGKEYADTRPEDYFYTDEPNKEEARALSRAAHAITAAAEIIFYTER